MKKNLLFLSLSLLMISLSQAQVKKDRWLLGGQLSFNSNKTTVGNQEQESNGSLIQFSAGKAIRDNHVFGGQFSVGFFKGYYFNGIETGNQRNQDYSAGVFYRLYKPIGKEFFFFGQTNADFRWGKGDTEFPSSLYNGETSSIGGSLYVTPGIAYAVFPRFHLELTLPGLFGISYNRSTTNYPNAQTQEQVNRTFNAFTSVSTNSQAGLLGVGFRLLL